MVIRSAYFSSSIAWLLCFAVFSRLLACHALNDVYEPTTIPSYEYNALQDLYNSTDGDNWLWGEVALRGPTWFAEAPDPCSTPMWQGLNCSCVKVKHSLTQSCHVTSIKLDNYRLTGTLPQSLANLTELSVLILEKNRLNGTIPDVIGNISLLALLNLGSNDFSGSFPNWIASMNALKYLTLSDNAIKGTIPEEVFSMSNLRELDLSQTFIGGTLSESVVQMTNLTDLSLSECFFVGSLPSTLGRMTGLKSLQLYSNQFNGTIPESLYWMQGLQVLYLYKNFLWGPLSESVANLTSMQDFQLGYNILSGSLPKAIGRMPSIRILQLRENHFIGSIPEEFYNASTLNNIFIDDNILSGTISANISNLKDLTEITFNDNGFTGSIPEAFCECTKFYSIDLFVNYLSGSLPECLFKLRALSAIRVNYNLMTGPLPSLIDDNALLYVSLYINQFSGPLPERVNNALVSVEFYNNSFTGSIPDTFFHNRSAMETLMLNDNYLTGTIPQTIGDLYLLKYLYMYTNLLSGTLPKELSQIPYLVIAFFNKNLLSGPLLNFNATTQSFLTSIELSNNQFTGSIPAEAFRLPNLQTFAIVSNCLTGTIPDEVCNAKYLSALALDGMHTASSCQQKILPYFDSYTVKYNIPGTVPWCLFSMSSLQTLHASGNGLVGSFPADLQVSPGLTDLVLSYNAYSGSIPKVIARQQFTVLDMSFNKLTGVLDDTNVTVPDDGYLYLQVNRLSGHIPNKLRDAETISILDGNLFECQYNRHSLPPHDKQYPFYECGTSSLQHALYAWVILACLLAALLVAMLFVSKVQVYYEYSVVIKWLKSVYNLVTQSMEIFSENSKTSHLMPNIKLFSRFMDSLRRAMCISTLYILLVLMTINVVISRFYGTYQYMYAWNVSSVYLSGETPAIILLVFLLLWLCWMFGTFHYFLIPFGIKGKKIFELSGADRESESSIMTSKHHSYLKHYLCLGIIAIFNFVVVLAVNIGYVYVTTEYRPSVVAVVQLIIAMFKLLWNDAVIRSLTNVAYHYSTRLTNGEVAKLTERQQRSIEGKYMVFHTYTMLFNIIITPCLATAFVSSYCFYNVIFPASEINLSYSYLTCGSLISAPNSTCQLNVAVLTQTSYEPPFTYRYQCSSTLVTTYAVLYVYMFILTGLAQPITIMFLTWYNNRSTTAAAAAEKKNLVPESTRLFFKDRFNLRVITFLSVYVTFGVIFPPLGVIICIALCVQSYFQQMTIGHQINKEGAKDEDHKLKLLDTLEKDCVNTADLFKHSLYDVGPVAALFYSFIIFDTYGDAEGGKKAIGVTVTMIVVGTLLSCAAYIVLNVNLQNWWVENRHGGHNESKDFPRSEFELQRTTSVLAAVKMSKDSQVSDVSSTSRSFKNIGNV